MALAAVLTLTIMSAPTQPVGASTPGTPSYVGSRNGIPQYTLGAGAVPAAARPTERALLADYRLNIGGVARSYRLFVPTGLRGPAPVIVAMTGWTMTGDPDLYMRWRALAVARHLVVLEPRGYGASWNAGSCCGAAVAARIDDSTALLAMLRSAAHVYPINPHRVYLVGFSNGGMMALDFACRHPGVVAAVGVVAAAYMSRCVPSRAVPLMHVHGSVDGALPLNGGWSNLLRRNVPSAAWTDDRFRALDAAAGTPVRSVRVRADHVWPRIGWQGDSDTTSQLFAYLWQFQR